MVETVKETELEVESKEVRKLLWFHDKILMNEELILMGE
jgi:hypothetical protein